VFYILSSGVGSIHDVISEQDFLIVLDIVVIKCQLLFIRIVGSPHLKMSAAEQHAKLKFTVLLHRFSMML
jgi:hypothetical protein